MLLLKLYITQVHGDLSNFFPVERQLHYVPRSQIKIIYKKKKPQEFVCRARSTYVPNEIRVDFQCITACNARVVIIATLYDVGRPITITTVGGLIRV